MNIEIVTKNSQLEQIVAGLAYWIPHYSSFIIYSSLIVGTEASQQSLPTNQTIFAPMMT